MSIAALFSVYMLYGSKFVNFGSTPELKVASIVEQLKTVKRKRDFYQGWMDVKQGDNLTQNDEIYTHGQSSAKIRFINGPEISLFENSLLRIKKASKGNSFALDKGNLIAKLGPNSPNLNIELNGKKYSFISQNANIQIEQSKTENKFLLLDGKAKLAGQEILPNQVLIQNIQTGSMQVKEIPFISKTPANNLKAYFVKELNLIFSWSSKVASSPARLLISKNSDFTDLISDELIDSNSQSVNFVASGTYFWKLSSVDKLDGPIRSFTLIEETKPSLNLDQEVVYKGPKSSEKVFISWTKNHGKKFLLKIETPDGKTGEIETVKNNYELIPKLTGKYKISVKVKDDQRPFALWSDTAVVTVNEAASISISSLTPELMEKVNYKNEASSYTLSWNGPHFGVNYQIRIIKNKKVLTLETDRTSYPVSLKDEGEYTWEIQGETVSGVISNKITGKILIKAPLKLSQLPGEGAVVELDKPDQLVAFKWDKVDEAAVYQFELSDESSFKKIIVARDIETNNLSTSLADTGRYFWRVKIKRGNNVEFSNPVSVEIRPSPPLSRPEISPDIKVKLKYLEEKSSSFNMLDLFFAKAEAAGQIAIAEWDLPANPRAKSYVVEVYKDQDLKELIIKLEVETPHVIWRNALPGKFFWRVSYNDFWGRKTEFSKISVLSTEGLAPVEIELQNPKHRAAILKFETEEEIFIWEEIRDAKNYQILIAEDLEFEKIIFKKQISKNEIKIKCKNLDSKTGEYFWKVISNESSSKRRQFEASCEAPPLVVEKKEANQEAEKKKVQNLKIEEFKKSNPHFFRAGLFPHHIAYENKAQAYNAKVDGNVIDSWYVMYQTPLDLKYFQTITPSIWVSRGKVFDTITFTDFEVNVKAHRLQTSFSWGPVLAFMKKTLYVESGLTIKDEGLSTPLVGIFLQKELSAFTIEAEAKVGALQNIQAGFQYHMKNNISVGAMFDTTSTSKDNNKHSFSRYGLNLNYIFDLLDATK